MYFKIVLIIIETQNILQKHNIFNFKVLLEINLDSKLSLETRDVNSSYFFNLLTIQNEYQ